MYTKVGKNLPQQESYPLSERLIDRYEAMKSEEKPKIICVCD